MSIIFVPIDNRPCTMIFPAQLAKIGGYKIKIPPENLLGIFKKRGDSSKILSWLYENTKKEDIILLSLDMLIYGGLVASRNMNNSTLECEENAKKLEEFLKTKPASKIIIFSSIMRTLPTFTNEKILLQAEKIKKHIKKLYPISPLSESEFSSVLKEISKDVEMKDFFTEYILCRKRNFDINLKACKWRKDNLIDRLLIGLDDVVCIGPNTMEAEKIKTLMKDDEKTTVCNGTDELAMLAEAMIIKDDFSINPTFAIHYSSEEGSYKNTIYESKPVRDVVIEYIKASGCKIVEENADIDLFCKVHPNGQKETEIQHLEKKEKDETFVNLISEFMKKGKNVAVADVKYANGADINFTKILIKKINLASLLSYAAWNTSGNTLGTTISHAIIRYIAKKLNRTQDTIHVEFMYERFLDDFIYQSIIRAKMKMKCLLNGISFLDMKEQDKQKISLNINKEMKKYAEKLSKSGFKKNSPKFIKAELPWSRLFEVFIKTKL